MRRVFFVAPLAAVLAALAVALGATHQPFVLAGALVAVAALAGLARVVGAACAPGRLDLFSPIVAFPLLYLVWFGVASIPLLHDLDPPRALTPIATEWPIYALGLGAWFVGTWLASRVLGVTPVAGEHRPLERFDSRRLFVACVILFAVAATATAAIVARRSTPLLTSKVEATRLLLTSSGWERLLFTGFATVAILVLAHAARERFRIALRFWALLALSILGLATAGERGLVVLPVACGVILAHYLWRALRPAHLATVLLPLAVFASATVIYRGTNTYGPQYVAELQRISGVPRAALPAIPIYQGMWSGPNVFYRLQDVVPAKVGHGWGTYAAAPLVSFLPGEQEWAADAIKRTLDDRFIGLGEPATLLGAFYLDFGFVGIAVGMAVAGFALTALYRRLRLRRDLFTTILFAHASFVAFLSLYGDLYNGNPLLLWNGALTWLVCRFAAKPDASAA